MVHVEWAPKGHALVIIHEYDIYYKPDPRAETTYRVTNDAIPGAIYNGVPDWLYEGKNVNFMLFEVVEMFNLENVVCFYVKQKRF